MANVGEEEVDSVSEELDSAKFFTAEGSSDDDETYRTAGSSVDLSPDKNAPTQVAATTAAAEMPPPPPPQPQPQPKPASTPPTKRGNKGKKESKQGPQASSSSAKPSRLKVTMNPLRLPPPNAVPSCSEPAPIEEWVEVKSRRERKRTMSGSKKVEDLIPFFKVHPTLKEYKDCFFDWVSKAKPFTEETVATIASVLVSKYGRLTDEMLTKEIKVMPIETTANHLIMAFCYILMKDLPSAHETLQLVARIIQLATNVGSISTDHLEGLVYLFSGLEAHKQTVTIEMMGGSRDKEGERLLDDYIKSITPYNGLSVEAKIAIKGVRAYFLGSSRILPEQLQLLKEIVNDEPTTVEWRVVYHYVLRLARKEADRRAIPTITEKQAVLKCLELAETNVSVKLAVCLYISDIVRLPERAMSFNLLDLSNGVRFDTFEKAVKHVRRVADEILLEMGHSTKINLCLADIFTSAVPYKLRDSKFAKKCFQNALQTNPMSSKANHKFGLYMLTQENKPVEALQYVEKALMVDNRNFSALIDKIQIMMGNLGTYEAQIEALFNEHKNNEKWAAAQRGSLHALSAVFHFMRSQLRETIIAWVNARKTHTDGLTSLELVQYHIKRYKWDESLVTPQSLRELTINFQYGRTGDFDLFTDPNRLCIAEAFQYLEMCCKRIEAKQEQAARNAAAASLSRGRGKSGRGRGHNARGENHTLREGASNGTGPSTRGGKGNPNSRGQKSIFRSNYHNHNNNSNWPPRPQQ